MQAASKPPYFLSAKSPQDLRMLMLANNRKRGKRFHYFDMSFAQGKWWCWFEIDETERLDNVPK